MTERYKRQEIISGWDQKSLSNGRVLVLGAGTTGNEVVKNLALLGVGKIVIVDRDLVEEVNLNRCVLFRDSDIGKPKAEVAARRAKELNPHIAVEAWNLDIVHEIGCLEYRSFQCVVLTVDNLRARMWVNRYCRQMGVPLINTGIEGWTGNVFTIHPSCNSVCLECSWTNKEYRLLGEEYSCSKIGLAFSERKIPMVITSAAIVGGIAAQEVVKILQGRHDSLLSKNYWWFDGETGALLTWAQPPKEGCAHNTYPFLSESDIWGYFNLERDVRSVKEELRAAFNTSVVEIKHDKEIVYSVSCRCCGYSRSLERPISLEKYRRTICPQCSFLEVVPDDLSEEVRDGYTFAELGIPANHLLRVYYDSSGTIAETWIATCR